MSDDIIHDLGSAEDETNEFYHKWLDRKAEAESLRSELEASRHRVAELERKLEFRENVTEASQEFREALIARNEAFEAALTPSEETKFAYMGEVNFWHTDFDEGGNEHRIRLDVPWTSIKALMKLIRENADRRARSTLEGKHPNAESLAAMQELEDGGGETFASVDDLMKDLESDDLEGKQDV